MKIKLLVIARPIDECGTNGRLLRNVIENLKADGNATFFTTNWRDAISELRASVDIGAIIVEWDNNQGGTPLDLGADAPLFKDLFLSKGEGIPSSAGILLTLARKRSLHIKNVAKPLKCIERSGSTLVIPRDLPPEIIKQICAAQKFSDLGKLLVENKVKIYQSSLYILQRLHEFNRKIPVFLVTEDKIATDRIPIFDILDFIRGYIIKGEESPNFVAKRIDLAANEYLKDIMPPFFAELVRYSKICNYSWHTPGHGGGIAFTRSPPGKLFIEFYGENSCRADLSVSVPELGSLLEHSSVVGLSEANAARVFGSEHTFFVTNGTSTSNKIVLQSCLVPHDIVLLDRNSHKSSMQSIQQTDAWPIYLLPVRNSYGILGPTPINELRAENLAKKLEATPYSNAKGPIKLLILTNSTYDGICYSVPTVLEKVRELKDSQFSEVKNILFDEAWSAYAHFSVLYDNFHAMCTNCTRSSHGNSFSSSTSSLGTPQVAISTPSTPLRTLSIPLSTLQTTSSDNLPKNSPVPSPSSSPLLEASSNLSTSSQMGNTTIFATQSTHKVLAAFSQASMIHVRNTKSDPFFHHSFNNAYMMNTSTSPQYSIIASLDVATAMMDLNGKALVGDSLKEAVSFRKKMSSIRNELLKRGDWFFNLWQPADVSHAKARDPSFWILPESSPTAWHGFEGLMGGRYMLDPLKVTIITRQNPIPGKKPVSVSVPAPVLARYLHNHGVVVEKTGFFTVLVLFTIGVTKGKAGTLIILLNNFKHAYDSNASISQIFPELASRFPLYSDRVSFSF